LLYQGFQGHRRLLYWARPLRRWLLAASRLLLPALARAPAGPVLLVGAPHMPFGPGLAAQGLAPARGQPLQLGEPLLGEHLLGWMKDKWRDDTLLFAVYLACYGLQYALVWLMDKMTRFFFSQATDLKLSEDDKEPLVIENVGT
jgi:hypothetical protein